MSRIKVIEPYSWLDGQLQYSPARVKQLGMIGEEARGFYPGGEKKFSYPLLNGKPHGVCKIWHQNGALKKEEPYEGGELTGLVREWYSSGAPESETAYMKGLRHGIQRLFLENGQRVAERNFRNDRLHGEERKWHVNGQLESFCSYANGLRSGRYQKSDENGKIIEDQFYVRGIVLNAGLKKLLDSNSLTAQKIMSIGNTSVRRVLLEEFGYERFLRQSDHEVIEKCGEQELVKINWHKQEEPLFLVKVRCATTGVFYTLRVPPTMKTVQEAVAWTFELKPEEYKPEKET
jgi:antitoxin component YwqK of YwqJK toxin-antitoxin module